MKNDELRHYGILGQKWGIRRYQNSDGSYTKAGLERYFSSKRSYDASKRDYLNNKNNYASKLDRKVAKHKVKKFRKQMNEDYKHLHLDKLADKGKKRYASGQRILGNEAIRNFMASVSTIGYSAAVYGKKKGYISDDTAKYIALGTTALNGAAIAKKLIDELGPNRELRAFYAHTSNYNSKPRETYKESNRSAGKINKTNRVSSSEPKSQNQTRQSRIDALNKDLKKYGKNAELPDGTKLSNFKISDNADDSVIELFEDIINQIR